MRALRLTIRELGALNALLYWCAQLLARLSAGRCGLFRYYFVVQTLTSETPAPQRSSNFEFGLQTAASPLLLQSPRPSAVLRQRFAQGALCLTAALRGQLVATIWFVPRRYLEDEVRACYLMAGNDGGWDFDLWIAPEFRTGVLYFRLWQTACGLMRQHRLRWSCSRISAFNSASLRLHKRMQLQRCGVANFIRLGRWQLTLASIAPYVHWSGHAADQPRFSFDPYRQRQPDKDYA